MSLFTLPSAPFLTQATEAAYDTPYYALAGSGGGGSNLPAGTDGAYLYNNSGNWVAQTDPIRMGSNSTVPASCVSIGQNNSLGTATNCFVVGNGVNFNTNPDSSVALGDNIDVVVNNAVAIGSYASVGGDSGVAIGNNASVGTSPFAVSIGVNAGNKANSKDGTVNIGQSAGNAGPTANQGTNAINIGKNAGVANGGSVDNSITLNASGNNFSAEYSSLYVNPVLASTMTNYLSYDPTSGLVGYGTPAGGGPPSFTFATGSNSGSLNTANNGGNAYFNYQITGLTSGTTYQLSAIMPFRVIQSTTEQWVALTANSYCQAFLANGSILAGGTVLLTSPPFPCGALPATFADSIVTSLSGTFTAGTATILYMVFYSATPVSNPTNPNNNWTFTTYALT